MRLWHQSLIPLLPRQQLLGQHRECCALRGRGWGRKQSTVDYVFKYDKSHLVAYHFLVIREMKERKYNVAKEWEYVNYNGKVLGFSGTDMILIKVAILISMVELVGNFIYKEHDEKYLKECKRNLKLKGIKI